MELEPIHRLSRDLKKAAATLSNDEARYLVDAYYQMQADRIRSENQVRALSESAEPHSTLQWLSDNSSLMERSIQRALDEYGNAHTVGVWSKSIVGIGPVISAGLIAHIDLEPWKCGVVALDRKKKACTAKEPHGPACHAIPLSTVGQIWRFAGLDPTVTWEKGKIRPWNASLKTLCWKIGQSFMKVSGNERDFYGKLYLTRKASEIRRNDDGVFADQAADKLVKFKIGRETEARKHYELGRLPPAHIDARARRWVVKLFLSHWHAVAHRAHFGTDAPKPYVISQLHHGHEITVPNWPF